MNFAPTKSVIWLILSLMSFVVFCISLLCVINNIIPSFDDLLLLSVVEARRLQVAFPAFLGDSSTFPAFTRSRAPRGVRPEPQV